MFLTTTSSSISQNKSHQIQQDNNFFSRHLSKETSISHPSFRVYYNGVSVAVPFTWESQPGIPKHKSLESTLPPLTPPPSYYKNNEKKPTLKRSRSNVFNLFPRIYLPKKTNVHAWTLSPTPSSVSLSSWNSSGFLTSRKCVKGSFDVDPPTSLFCFGGLRKMYYA